MDSEQTRDIEPMLDQCWVDIVLKFKRDMWYGIVNPLRLKRGNNCSCTLFCHINNITVVRV